MKRISIIILLVGWLAPHIQAKEGHRDTLRLLLPNNVMIDQLVYYRKPIDSEPLKDFKIYLEAFLQDFKKLDPETLSDSQPMKFIYNYSNGMYSTSSITFDEYNTPTTILFTKNETDMMNEQKAGDEILITKRTHFLELIQNEYPYRFKALVYFNSLKQLEELLAYNFEELNGRVQEILNNKKLKYLNNKPYTTYIRFDDKIQAELVKVDIPKVPGDVIQLSAGSGLQSLKGEWLGSFSIQATMILARKGIDKHAISFSYEWMYNFTTPNEKYVNEFIDLSYAYNFSKTPGDDSWIGLSFGFNTKRRGEFFTRDTYRLGLNTRLNKHLAVGPEMYFNDFFKNVYPGVNVTITLL